MPEVFVDTAGWAQIIDPKQPRHSTAREIYLRTRQQRWHLITTNYIITELVATLTSPLRIPRPKVIEIIEDLKVSSHIRIVHIDSETDAKAWQLLASRVDKEWSLVDCASFVIMQERGITDALTTDHHFEQAGFVRLLEP